MSIALFIFWGAVGWCGTPWPRRWPPPPPPPDPWWFISRIIGIAGGVIGGWLFNRVWPVQGAQGAIGLAVAASGVGALAGSIILEDILGLVRGGPRAKPPAA